MSAAAIAAIVAVFAVLIGVPLAMTLHGTDDTQDEIQALRHAPELESVRRSPELACMLQAMEQAKPVTRLTIRPDGCRIERRIDEQGEVVDVQPICHIALGDQPLTEKQMHCYRFALTERLGADYVPQLLRDKKSGTVQGWCIYLHPARTGAIIHEIHDEERYRA